MSKIRIKGVAIKVVGVKVAVVMLVLLLNALLIYPILHEGGHFIACKLVGAEVSKFSLLPAYVECDIDSLNDKDIILIGLGGNTLPTVVMLIITVFTKPANLYTLFVRVHLAYTCWLSWIISFVNVVLVINGHGNNSVVKTDDIAQVVIGYTYVTKTCLIICIILIIISTYCMINKNVIRTFKKYTDNI